MVATVSPPGISLFNINEEPVPIEIVVYRFAFCKAELAALVSGMASQASAATGANAVLWVPIDPNPSPDTNGMSIRKTVARW